MGGCGEELSAYTARNGSSAQTSNPQPAASASAAAPASAAAAAAQAGAESSRPADGNLQRDLQGALTCPNAETEALSQRLSELLAHAAALPSADSSLVGGAAQCAGLLLGIFRSHDATLHHLNDELVSAREQLTAIRDSLCANAGTAGSREQALLGQVVRVLDLAAARYVLDPRAAPAASEPPPPRAFPPFPRLLTYRERGALSRAEEQRLAAFLAFLADEGWGAEELCDATEPLRDFGGGGWLPPAPPGGVQRAEQGGESGVEQRVTEEELRGCAARLLDPVAEAGFERLLPLLRKLTAPGRPLAPRSDLHAIVEAAANFGAPGATP